MFLLKKQNAPEQGHINTHRCEPASGFRIYPEGMNQ